MKVKKIVQELFKSCDLFAGSKFIRYKKDQDYSTASGGCISMGIIVIFLILFYSTAIQTLNRSIITADSTTSFSNTAAPTNISFSSDSKFMITVGIIGLNLSDPNMRYFDIQLVQQHYGTNGIPLDNKTVALVPCTIEHFSMNQRLKQDYSILRASSWLCPPLNYSYQIFGQWISPESRFLQVTINKCNNSLDLSRPCINQSMIDDMITNYGSFPATLFFVNTMINAGNSNYLDYYLQGKNFITFTKELGANSIAYVQDFQIDTDQSLLPFTQTKSDIGIRIPNLFQTIPFSVTGNNYGSFAFMKSSSSTTYTRSFNKMDQLFSYIGGLVGTILGVMLFMGKFTSMAFALDASQSLFKYTKKKQGDFKNFNLFSYLLYLVYKVGSAFKCFNNWSQMKKRQRCLKEIQKQLDINLFLKRFNFLQKSMHQILGEDKYKSIHLQNKQILTQIRARRRFYSKKILIGNLPTNQNYQSSSEDSQSNESDKIQGNIKSDQRQSNVLSLNDYKQIKVNPNDRSIIQSNIQRPEKQQKQSRKLKGKQLRKRSNFKTEQIQGGNSLGNIVLKQLTLQKMNESQLKGNIQQPYPQMYNSNSIVFEDHQHNNDIKKEDNFQFESVKE